MGHKITILKYVPIFIGFALKRIPFYFETRNKDILYIRKRAHEITRKHVISILNITKTNMAVSGQENIPKDGPVVFLGNHQSYFDVLAMQSQMEKPTMFIAKKELLKWPVYSWWMKDMGCLFLDREDPREAVKTFNEAARRMKEEGLNAVIYPEGTRSKSSVVHDFQKGSFKLGEKANRPIVPVMIEGAFRVLEEDNKLKPNETIYLRFLPPVYMDQLSKEKEKVIHKTVRQEIADEIARVQSLSK